MADAIHSAPRWETRPDSAVTRPPPPRLTTRSPSSLRSNSAGPRLETTTRRCSLPTTLIRMNVAAGCAADAAPGSHAQVGEELEPVTQKARRQEPLARALLARPPHV